MSSASPIAAQPAHLLEALDRLTATPESAVRLDARRGAIQLTTHDPSTGIWETVFVPAAPGGGGGAQPAWSATVRHGDLRRAAAFAPSQGLTEVELRSSDGRVTVDGDHVNVTDPIDAAPQSGETLPVELELPERGPADVIAADTERLRVPAALVTRLRSRTVGEAEAFQDAGRWYVSVRTGSGDVRCDPVVVAEVAASPVGTE